MRNLSFGGRRCLSAAGANRVDASDAQRCDRMRWNATTDYPTSSDPSSIVSFWSIGATISPTDQRLSLTPAAIGGDADPGGTGNVGISRGLCPIAKPTARNLNG